MKGTNGFFTVLLSSLVLNSASGSLTSFLSGEPSVPCPSVCACTQIDTARFNVDCSGRDLTIIPVDAQWPNKSYELIINFEGNNIRQITGFPDVKAIELSFKRNIVTEIEAGAFANLTSLVFLDLSFNNLTGMALKNDVFRGPSGLVYSYNQLYIEKLDLTANRIHSLDKDTFDFIEGLKEVILDKNDLLEIDVPTTMALASITSLEILSLAETGLKDLPQGGFNSLTSLLTVNLGNNLFERVPETLGSARNLKELNLNANLIEFLDDKSFVGLESLVSLNISGMPRLQAIKEGAFSPLKSLRILRCTSNPKLAKIHTLAFESMAASQKDFPIRELHLSDNALTTLSSALVAWDSLELLDIQGNPWNCDCGLKWMTVTLLDHLERMNPSLAFNIVCDAPSKLHGTAMVTAGLDPEQFVCPGKRRSSSRRAGQPPSDEEKSAAGATVAVIMTGILIIVLSVGALMWMMHGKKKRRGTTQVQYTRAPEDDSVAEA